MASNVVRLHQRLIADEPKQLLESVTVRHEADILNAAKAMASIAKNRGMRIMMWHDISSQDPMLDLNGQDLNSCVFGNGDDGAALCYNYNMALRSPLIRACRVEGEPFWVNRDGFRSHSNNPILNEIDIEDFEESSPVRAAIVIPLHLPFGQIAVTLITSFDESKEDLSSEFFQFGHMFGELIRRFVNGYVSTTRNNPYLPVENVLTQKEIQCVRWASFGKTDIETSIILECSHAVVRYHINRVCEKLGAANRTQAIFRAGQLGFLGSLS